MSITGGEIRPFRLLIVSFMEPVVVHDRQLAVYLAPVSDGHGPFLCRFEGGQIKGLQKSLVAWENTSLAVQLAICGVQTLNRIRGIMPISA